MNRPEASARTRLLRIPGAVTAVALATAAFAGPAAAHVVSDGSSVPAGGSGIVHLIVPNESDKAKTVGLTVTIPPTVTLKSARTLPIPGWTGTVDHDPASGRVTRITWSTADPANGFGVSEYREFSFSAGPWPTGANSVALPSDQRYSDGTVVSWNEIAVDKTSEPEHPAPVVTVGAAVAGHGGHEDDDAVVADHHDAAHSDSASNEGVWRAIAVLSLVVAVVTAAGLALVVRRGRVTGS
jgi:uncharacterized protein YcnI